MPQPINLDGIELGDSMMCRDPYSPNELEWVQADDGAYEATVSGKGGLLLPIHQATLLLLCAAETLLFVSSCPVENMEHLQLIWRYYTFVFDSLDL